MDFNMTAIGKFLNITCRQTRVVFIALMHTAPEVNCQAAGGF